MSKPEDELALQLTALEIPFKREYRFYPRRRWRADFKLSPMILVEVEGGIWMRGRHNRGEGYTKDAEKYNEAQLLGYLVLRFTPEQVKDGKAIATIERAIEFRLEQL